jgi:hypothetical protein
VVKEELVFIEKILESRFGYCFCLLHDVYFLHAGTRLCRKLICDHMPKRAVTKDLFGKPVRQRRPRYEAALERGERKSLPARAARVRWLSEVIPKNLMFGMPLETGLVFEEAKASFVYGNFVAVIVLAASFIEHWFIASLSNRGYQKEASQGLAAAINCARTHKLVAPLILDKADRVRLIRNPFVHLKSFEHQHTIGQRMAKTRTYDIPALLEADAKEALIAMYGVAAYAFSR